MLAAVAWAGTLWWLSSRQIAIHAPAGSDKVAHFLVYALLAALLRRAFGPGLRWPVAATVAAAAIATAYGAIDEVHQSFVPGRSATVADGVADAAGAIIGAWLASHAAVLRPFETTRRRS